MHRKQSVTVQDVAKVAGVSTATVSRTLSNPDLVSETTREAVFAAIRETNYTINRAARSLRTNRTNTIMVIVPDLANPFFSQVLGGIGSVLAEEQFSMLVTGTQQIAQAGETIADYLHDGRADGIIVLDGSVPESLLSVPQDEEMRHKIVFACEWIEDRSYISIRSRNRTGAKMATKHLYDLGHRKIGHIAGPTTNVLSRLRTQGYLEALAELQISPNDDWILPGGFEMGAGRKAAKMFLEMEDRPTAMFCASDLLAYTFIYRLMRESIRVPHEVSVIGFDDIELSSEFFPPLSTVRQDRSEIGKLAARAIIDLLSGQGVEDSDLCRMVDVELVPRESTAELDVAVASYARQHKLTEQVRR